MEFIGHVPSDNLGEGFRDNHVLTISKLILFVLFLMFLSCTPVDCPVHASWEGM